MGWLPLEPGEQRETSPRVSQSPEGRGVKGCSERRAEGLVGPQAERHWEAWPRAPGLLASG